MFSQCRFKLGRKQVFPFPIFIAITIIGEFNFLFDVATFSEVFLKIVNRILCGENVIFFIERIKPIKRLVQITRSMGQKLLENLKNTIERFDIFGNVLANDNTFSLIEFNTL